MLGLTLTIVARDVVDQANDTVDSIQDLSEWINRYGFMVIFSSVALILVICAFFMYMKRASKKDDKDNEILIKERMASIEQGKQMFDLVTNVQTEQVTQLQQMTAALQEMNKSIIDTDTKVRHWGGS